MNNSVKLFLTLFFLPLFFISCSDNITNHYNEPEEEVNAGPPDVNIISSEYSFETIHSSHIDTNMYSSYNYSINLDLFIDKPENRDQINKIIIINENGFGWDFLKKDLDEFYIDSLNCYSLKHLLPLTSESSYYSRLYKVRLFSASNVMANEYQFILNGGFVNFGNFSHGWYTERKYQIYLQYYDSYNLSLKLGEIVWLDSQKEIISKENFSGADINSSGYLAMDNVPDNAYYFYCYSVFNLNNIKSTFLSQIFAIEERFPSNIQIIEFPNYYYGSTMYHLKEAQKLLISDQNYSKLYIYNSVTLDLETEIVLNSSPQNVFYSNYDQRIYLALQNGRLYSLGLDETKVKLEKTLGSYIYGIVSVDKFIVAATDYNIFKVYNIENDSIATYTSNYYNNSYQLLYNENTNVIYSLYSYSSIRFKIDLATGALDNFTEKYTNYDATYPGIIYSNGTKLLTSNGNIFSCNDNSSSDLNYLGTIGSSYNYAQITPDNLNIMALNTNNYNGNYGISIYSGSSYSLKNNTSDFLGNPLYFYLNGNDINVISLYNNRLIAEKFSLNELLEKNTILAKLPKLKYYHAKKLVLN